MWVNADLEKQYRREGIGKNMTSLRILSKVSQAVKNKTCVESIKAVPCLLSFLKSCTKDDLHVLRRVLF